MDAGGRRHSGESSSKGDAAGDTVNVPPLLRADAPVLDAQNPNASTSLGGTAAAPLPPLAPLPTTVRIVPTLLPAAAAAAAAVLGMTASSPATAAAAVPALLAGSSITSPSSVAVPPTGRAVHDVDAAAAEEAEVEEEGETFLTNGSIALAEFTSLLKPTENNSFLKEHIIHLLRDVDTEETLVRIARTLESHEVSTTAVDVSSTTWAGSSREANTFATASQSTTVSSATQRRRSSAASRRDATGFGALAGLSFLHSRRRATSASAQDSPSSAHPSEDVSSQHRSTRGLGGPMDASSNSRSSFGGTREAEEGGRRLSKPPAVDPLSALMATNASQLSETTTALRDDPLLREAPQLPTAVRSEGRRVAVSAAPCMPPPDLGSTALASSTTAAAAAAAAAELPPLRVVSKSVAEEQQLRRLLRRCHTFSSLEADTLEVVVKAMEKEVHGAGTAILEQGHDTTEKLYLVGEGTCEAIKNGKSLGPLQPGGTFGELELMYKQAKCAATIRCVTRCVFFTLDEASYHRVVMTGSLQKRQKFEKLTMNVPFLRCLPAFERMKIAEALETRVYKRGKTIIRFGSPGNYMHCIVEGEVKVIGRNSGRRVEVVRLRDGDVVGELEFLFNHLTVADVVATSREVRTACISREHFELILGPIQERLKEFVATSATYEKYYVSEVADESVRSELSRIESSRKHRRIASRDMGASIMDTDPRGEVLLSAPLALLRGKGGGGSGGGGGSQGNDLAPRRRQAALRTAAGGSSGASVASTAAVVDDAARGSAQLPQALLRFPFAPITGTATAVLALREDGLVVHWNAVLAKLTSYSAEEAVGQNIYSFLLSEREQHCMYKAISTARTYAGEAEAFMARPSTKAIHVTLARSDGLTKTTIRLFIVPPVVAAGGDTAEVVLGFGEEVREGPQTMLEQPQWLSSQIRAILADGTQTFEERLEGIAETLNNFESTYRAMTVSTERLRVVNVRQMMGHVLMDFGSECVSRGVSVRQRFDALPSERAYLDADLLPECLRYAMQLCLRYSDAAGGVITLMITVTEKNGLEFLVINFNLSGDGMPAEIVKFFDSPLNHHGDSGTTTASGDAAAEDDDSDDDSDSDDESDGDSSMALRHSLRPRLRRKLRRVQRAVEQQGGTLRMLRTPHDSNIAFLIPFMPAGEQDVENASIEETLDTLVGSASASASLAGMTGGLGGGGGGGGDARSASLLPGDHCEAPGSVSLSNTPAAEASGALNVSGGAAAAAAGQPCFSYTTCLAEDTPAHRIMLSSFLWERHHAVLTAFTFADVTRLVGVADILVIDLQQSAITSLSDLDPITRLRELLRHMAVVITSTSFDLVSSDTYAAAGFITLKKPCTPVQAMKALRRAEERSAVVKLERMRIEQTRETLARNSRGAWRHGALLGKGSFGEVYEAFDVLTGGKMAVKQMRLGHNDAKVEQFVQEISTMCNLQHPNIIHYFYCEESKEQKVIRVFMEFAGGGTLQSLLKRKGKLEYVELRALLRDVVEGLAYIHSQHYVHADIKTANVLLSSDGKGKIGDFGTARTVREGELLYVMQGSPLYMSPECMSAGETDDDGDKVGYSFPSDIWSLGCVAMEMATNRPPFAHIKSIKGPAGLTNFVTSLTDVPDLSPLFKCHPSIVEFVSACLNPDPSQRATANELLQLSLFSESTHGDRNSAVKALKRAQLLHVLNKFVAFQEPKEADERERRRNRFNVRRRASDFFGSSGSSSSSSSNSNSVSCSSRQASEFPLGKAPPPPAAGEAVASSERRRGTTGTTAAEAKAAAAAATAAAGEDRNCSDSDVPRRSGTAAHTGDDGLPCRPRDGAPTEAHEAASTFTRYLRKWDSSSSSSSSSSSPATSRPQPVAATNAARGGANANEAQQATPRHRDPASRPPRSGGDGGGGGGAADAEPEARDPAAAAAADAYDLSPTPKKRSTTRSRPAAPPEPARRRHRHHQRDRDSTTTTSNTTNSGEDAFFASSSSSSDSSSSGSSSSSSSSSGGARQHRGGAAPSKAAAVRATAAAAVHATSFPGRRRNVTLDETGNIVPFPHVPSTGSAATLPHTRGGEHRDSASSVSPSERRARGAGGGAAAAASADVAAPSQVAFSAFSDHTAHAFSPASGAGLANTSFAPAPGNLSFFNYSFNKNISFMGANMDDVLNSAANDFLNHLVATSHASNAPGIETASSAGSPVRVPPRAARSGSAQSQLTLSSNREADGAPTVATPLAAARDEDGDGDGSPSRRRDWSVSRSPSARNPLDARGPADPAQQRDGDGSGVQQRSGTTSPRPQTPRPRPPPLPLGAAPVAAATTSRTTFPISSRLGSASGTSDDATTSRDDSVPLVGAAAPTPRRRRVRPPITNQSFFVVEDRVALPMSGASHATSVPPFATSGTGTAVSAARVSFATLSSVTSTVDGGGGGGGHEGSGAVGGSLLQQHFSNVAVVAPPPAFSTFAHGGARAVWLQRRRHGPGSALSGAARSSTSQSRLPARMSNDGSVYLMAVDGRAGDDHAPRRAAGAAVDLEEGKASTDDGCEELASAAFGSVRSVLSQQSSTQSASCLTTEVLSTAHEQALRRRRLGSGGAVGEGPRRSAEAADAGPFSSLTTDPESPLFTYLQRINQSLQDVSLQLRGRRRQQQQQQRWSGGGGGGAGGTVVGVLESFDHGPSSTSVMTVRATPPLSTAPSATLYASLNSALLFLPASTSTSTDTAGATTAAHRHTTAAAAAAAASAGLPRPLSSRPPSVSPPPATKASRAVAPCTRASMPPTTQRSNPLWPTEDDDDDDSVAAAAGGAERDAVAAHPLRHYPSLATSDTPLSSSASGNAASSAGGDVDNNMDDAEKGDVGALLRKVLRRVDQLLEEVSHLSVPTTAASSPLVPPAATVAQTS
ncbi:protein kinase [Novymonas esmeraldas]|uniref:Protein kinase n=1 Tax=Novymonas esmeraldas TaxID=1808958 RepID=A0AAW0EQE4_9TRYP